VKTPLRFLALGLLLQVAFIAACSREPDVTLFQDASAPSGLPAQVGMTHGAAWGDFDGDGRPDLYVTNHLNPARLFRNLGDGRFEEATAARFDAAGLGGDKHGAAWADFDNDGRQDLVQLTGAVRGLGAEGKRLFHNTGDRFVDVAEPMGVFNPYARTRMPLWLDLDGDGKLDLLHGAEARFDDQTPPFAFRQTGAGFAAADGVLAFNSRSVPFCVLAELTGDSRPELVCRLVGKGTAVQVFDLSGSPAKVMSALPQTGFEDIASADFDNDGRMDLVLARKNAPGPVALGRPSATRVVASIAIDKSNVGDAAGLRWRAAGPVQVTVAGGSGDVGVTPEQVFLGAGGAHPGGLTFEATTGIGAMASSTPGAAKGVYVGFTAPDQWELRVTASRDALAAAKPPLQELQISVSAATPIEGLEAIGATAAEEAPFRLFMNRGGELVEEGEKRGVNRIPVAGMNVVAGDFDNDMDVDLYVLASGDIGQQSNLLLLNDGKGHFKVVRAAGGAPGSASGVGDSVTTADIDGDGLLDLFVANGGSMGRSLGLPSDGGGYQLFRNVAGNGNRWLMIDLQGSRSNRDGIGAVVQVTAGGVTQMRVQDGGVHHRGQNHSRLHFGLAQNTQVEKIVVRWPSGAVQELTGVAANQVLRIEETP
jgi:ASPIC and UnbV/FG-GAP-like repeat